jgi:hypothetical protein
MQSKQSIAHFVQMAGSLHFHSDKKTLRKVFEFGGKVR